MKTKRIKIVSIGTAVMLAFMLALTGCGTQEQPASPDSQPTQPSVQNTTAPDAAQDNQEKLSATADAAWDNFVTRDLTGELVDEGLFADAKLTMVNVWGTFCGPCRMEMPDLGELAEEYADKGLQIVGVVMDVGDGYGNVDQYGIDAVNEIIEATGADYRHLLRSPDVDAVMLADVYGVPTTYFVDAQGQLVGGAVVGALSKEEWISIIDERLADQLEGETAQMEIELPVMCDREDGSDAQLEKAGTKE